MLEMTNDLVDTNAIQQESVSQISKKVSSVFFKLQCDQMDAKSSGGTGGGGGGTGGGGAGKAQRWNSSSSAGRQEGKIAILTGQGVTESNVLDYLGCIEQRAVDIISEYLRVMSKDNPMTANLAQTNVKLHQTLTSGIRSPTPGPNTPMNWNRRSPTVDLNELAEDEFLSGLDAFPLAVAGGLNIQTSGNPAIAIPFALDALTMKEKDGAGGGGGKDGNGGEDNKVVDLNAFKSKLQKKLGLKESASTPTLFLGSAGSSRRK
jgi:hypothetical protein